MKTQFWVLTNLLSVCILQACKNEEINYPGNLQSKVDDIISIPAASLRSADELSTIYFGPLTFTRSKGTPITETISLENPEFENYENEFTLKIQNGDDKKTRVSSAEIKIDGVIIAGPSDFSKNVSSITKEITGLTNTSTLEVRLISTPGSFIILSIDGILKPDSTGTFIDNRDNTEYSYIKIGQQYWMQENLAYLPAVSPPWDGSSTDPFYYVYGYESNDVTEAKNSGYYNAYGVLYNWQAATNGESGSDDVPSDVQGVCPAGWHLPSIYEWDILVDYLGGDSIAGKKLKSESGWYNNGNGDNSSGFTGLPASLRDAGDGDFDPDGEYGLWWSSSEYSSDQAWGRNMNWSYDDITRGYYFKSVGLSIRCVKD
ncbi:MAG TPA: FISUMP domain-containing protein [Cyclobacteriaceae bacterium]|nr:FISUMP domain-containing protein [Cyclobacteriaceae bacterium]